MQRIRLNGIKDILFWIIIPLLAVGVLVLFDQLTKVWFTELYRENGNTIFIDGLLSFTYTVNTGSAFSFLSGEPWAQTFFKVLTIFALIFFVLIYLYALSNRYKTLSVSMVLIFSGTIGNFIDRLVSNGVVDFVKFEFINFPIFNLADILLTFGVIVFMVHFFFIDKNAVFKGENKENLTSADDANVNTENNDGKQN